MVLDAQQMESIKALIISDGKIGHLNQSIALCNYKRWNYEIVNVSYGQKWLKILSYLLDFLHIYTFALFKSDELPNTASIVIATGSTTYYPAKCIARQLRSKSVAIMLPSGYRDDFDFILAQEHDNPPAKKNIISLPINLVSAPSNLDYTEMNKRFVFDDTKNYIGLIIGGDNAIFHMTKDDLEPIIAHIQSLENISIVATTSRRTSLEIEEWLETLGFDYLLKYSEDQFNPIPIFLQKCKNIVITSDSTSMISEAAISGDGALCVVMLKSKKSSKFHRLIENLSKKDCLHIWDGSLGDKRAKIDISETIKEVTI